MVGCVNHVVHDSISVPTFKDGIRRSESIPKFIDKSGTDEISESPRGHVLKIFPARLPPPPGEHIFMPNGRERSVDPAHSQEIKDLDLIVRGAFERCQFFDGSPVAFKCPLIQQAEGRLLLRNLLVAQDFVDVFVEVA